MGMLRLLLALSVIVGHTTPIFGLILLPSNVAVQVFFIISGFYMALILDQKYCGNNRRWLFYSNRFLRLFPAYWLALLLTVGARALAGTGAVHLFGPTAMSMDVVSRALVGVSNIMIFGSDLLYCCHYAEGMGWRFTCGLPPAGPPDMWVRAGCWLMVNPVWSIGVELWFYLLAPTLTRWGTRRLLGLAVFSWLLRIGMDRHAAWSFYFFFPANLWFFLVGLLGYRFYRSPWFARLGTAPVCSALGVLMLALIVLRQFVPCYRNHDWMVHLAYGATLPFLFHAWRRVAWDRWIGNLSYPIYLVHLSVIIVLRDHHGYVSGWEVGAASVLLAVLINRYLETPLETFRQRRVEWRASAAATTPAVQRGAT